LLREAIMECLWHEYSKTGVGGFKLKKNAFQRTPSFGLNGKKKSTLKTFPLIRRSWTLTQKTLNSKSMAKWNIISISPIKSASFIISGCTIKPERRIYGM
jgi:hypothetical protein